MSNKNLSGRAFACLAAMSLGGAANADPPADDPRASLPDAKGAYTFKITVAGRAVDADGDPVAGAKVYLASPRNRGRPLASATTAADGRYRFESVPLPIDPPRSSRSPEAGSFEVFATAPGYALAWRPLKWFRPDQEHAGPEPNWADDPDLPTRYGRDDKIELDLLFGPPATFSGRIVDDAGRPIRDVGLHIRSASLRWKKESFLTYSSFNRELESLNWKSLVPASVKTRRTGADGRFEFTDLPQGARLRLDVRPPGRPVRSVYVVTGDIDFTEAGGRPVYTTGFELVFSRPKPVTIRVVHGDTGRPAPEAYVNAGNEQGSRSATTDQDGIAELMLPPGEHTLHLMPRTGTPYLATPRAEKPTFTVPAEGDAEMVEAVLEPAGILEFTVRTADLGLPLPGVDLWVERELSQGQAYQESYGYRSWTPPNVSHYNRPRTNQRGVGRAFFRPGEYRVGAGKDNFPEGYRAAEASGKKVVCRAGEVTRIEFTMEPRGR